MKLKPVKLAPALIALCVVLLVCLLRLTQPDFIQRLEQMTYDMRVREALKSSGPVSTNLGFVFISDDTIDQISKGLLGKPYGLYWPRHIYGRLLRELAAEHAQAVAFDVIFSGRRPDQGPVSVSVSKWPEAVPFVRELHRAETPVVYEEQGEQLLVMESDDYFAWQLRRAGSAILAADQGVQPDSLFATNALAVADVSANRDSDGVLRRVKAFEIYRRWHPLFLQVANDPDYGVDLNKARVEGHTLVLPRPALDSIRLNLDAGGNFEVADFLGSKIPAGWPEKAKAFTEERIWHLGIVLAARELQLDLSNAQIDLAHGRITLPGPHGRTRVIPVDHDGFFYVNWELPYGDPRVAKAPVQELLRRDLARSAGETNRVDSDWNGKLVVVGSRTVGNDLTDRGATPLEKDTLLASEHWNVANSVIMDRFVVRSSLGTDLLLIVALGGVMAFITWQLRALLAALLLILSILGYIEIGTLLYVHERYWIPLVLPVLGALLMTYVCLLLWRVLFEQAEQRRVRSIFSKIVSPNIVNELLQAEKLSLGGARREVTVLFADVRGFTEFTDASHEKAAEYVAQHKLAGAEVEAYFDDQARETLNTVNTYLALVADMVKKHDGTLDKYIGDCVMAFWGAPTPNPNHASACVRAAIDAQRAVHDLNQRRAEENKLREVENRARVSAGLTPKPLQPILTLGSGINTGMATVGLMGSEAHLSNYTVFGREINLASRLETLSGRGRVLISEATYQRLVRDDPALAATCVALPDANVKGIRLAVKVYEVPWQQSHPPAAPSSLQAQDKTDPSTVLKLEGK